MTEDRPAIRPRVPRAGEAAVLCVALALALLGGLLAVTRSTAPSAPTATQPTTTMLSPTTALPAGVLPTTTTANVAAVRPSGTPTTRSRLAVDLATAVLSIEVTPEAENTSSRFVALAGDGSARRVLFSVEGSASSASWSPDRRRIAFRAPDGAHVIDADGRNSRLVLPASDQDVADPRWSPDGKQVVAPVTSCYVPGGSTSPPPDCRPERDLYIASADGTTKRRLTFGKGNADYLLPDWSPDGRRILFRLDAGDPGSGIGVIDADGTDEHLVRPSPREATNDHPAAYMARWSPDGSQIAFAGGGLWHDVWMMESDGSGEHALFRTDADERHLAWSREGHEVAFTFDGHTSPGPWDVRVVNVATGAIRSLHHTVGAPISVDW